MSDRQPQTDAHPVYPDGPPCNPNCPGEHSMYHDGYADGFENGEVSRGPDLAGADPTQAGAVPDPPRDHMAAPWTVTQVRGLNDFQRTRGVRPFTCPDRGPWHADINSPDDVLVATIRGWVCPFCDYTQTWAHPVMAEARTSAPGSLDVAALRGAIYAVSVRHDWENTTDREDRTEEIAAEYERLTPFEYGGALVNQRFASDVEPSPDYEAMRMERGWPTPNHMRRAADALDMLVIPRYGDVLRWVADLCDAALHTETSGEPT